MTTARTARTARTPGRHSRRNRRIAIVSGGIVALVLAVSACSGSDGLGSSGSSGSSDSSDSGSAAESGGRSALDSSSTNSTVGGAPADAPDVESGGKSVTAAHLLTQISLGQALVKTASISMQTDNVANATDKIYALATELGGQVTEETTSADGKGEEVHARITLQVPVDKFDQAYAAVPTYGEKVEKNSHVEDVTSEVVDVDSRVASAKDSIASLRLLYGKANKLRDVIEIERELSQREADLESLQRQQAALAAETTMSTLSISIDRTEVAVAKKTETKQHHGFVSGIKKGWDALVDFVFATSHALGLLLPLGSVFIVLGLLGWAFYRRVIARRLAPAAPATATSTSE